jgi:flavin-dependent thymidylate synthase
MSEESKTDVQRWADKSMYPAAPISGLKVSLVNATKDPLGTMAAACMIYEGRVCGSTSDVTDEQRLHYWNEVRKTHLKAPLEFIDLHFFIEGVTRAFTHQMVRQRTAVYAQESMRFAVKENFAAETPFPPSLAALKTDDPKVVLWQNTMRQIQSAYEGLVSTGVPAEDARGLLPHQTTTRLHYKTNLRNLLDHAGNRLCTQAQFEWRQVLALMIIAMREMDDCELPLYWEDPSKEVTETGGFEVSGPWAIITNDSFRPVCYDHGHCPFNADFDRGCTIRERADRGAFDEINPMEWMANPRAAWQ